MRKKPSGHFIKSRLCIIDNIDEIFPDVKGENDLLWGFCVRGALRKRHRGTRRSGGQLKFHLLSTLSKDFKKKSSLWTHQSRFLLLPSPRFALSLQDFLSVQASIGRSDTEYEGLFYEVQHEGKKLWKMTVANLLLAEVLAGNKFVQEVTEAHFLPLEQSCSTGRGLVPYIRGQQLYLLSRRLVSLYHRTSLKWSNFSNYMETFWTFQAKINNFNIVVFYAVMTNYSLLASLAFIFILDVIHELALRSQVK